MNLVSCRVTLSASFLSLLCALPALSAVAEESGMAVGTAVPISLADVDAGKPIEYAHGEEDLIIALRYVTRFPVEIRIFGDGTLRGERSHDTEVMSDSGVFSTVRVRHTFTARLSAANMKGLLKSLSGLLEFDLPAVKQELRESAECWWYCPKVEISDGPGVTAELEINVLQYTLYSGKTVAGSNKTIKWDKTDVFEAAAKFPQVPPLQDLAHAIQVLLDFCDCAQLQPVH